MQKESNHLCTSSELDSGQRTAPHPTLYQSWGLGCLNFTVTKETGTHSVASFYDPEPGPSTSLIWGQTTQAGLEPPRALIHDDSEQCLQHRLYLCPAPNYLAHSRNSKVDGRSRGEPRQKKGKEEGRILEPVPKDAATTVVSLKI